MSLQGILKAIFTIIILCFVVPTNSQAQVLGSLTPSTIQIDDLSDEQIQAIRSRIRSENLTIEEALDIARLQGLPQSEINKLRVRLSVASSSPNTDEDRATALEEAAPDASVAPTNAPPESQSSDSQPSDVPLSATSSTDTQLPSSPPSPAQESQTTEDIPTEDEIPSEPGQSRASNLSVSRSTTPTSANIMSGARGIQTLTASIDNPIYGHSVFTDQTIDYFTTTDAARAPDWYVMGTGDQVRVTIFGASQADLLLEITDEGYVEPSGIPRIFLKGLTIKEAEDLLRERLSNFYSFESEELSLTMTVARTITINIFGEVLSRGSFTMSALNTALNALTVVGGITDIGSVRSIRLIRGEESKEIDLYEFLHNPSVQREYDIRHNDILYVPVAKKLVSLEGAVKRPMRFELKNDEGLFELLEYAGGINFNTSPNYVQVQRLENGEPVLTEYNLSDVLDGNEKVTLSDGDVVRVRQINRRLEQYVEIEGAVQYPGIYDLRTNRTMLPLLEKTGLLEGSVLEKAIVQRLQSDGSFTIIPVRLDSIISGAKDFAFEPEDRVLIYDQSQYSLIDEIEITGNVRAPITIPVDFDSKLRLADALFMAEGLQPTATSEAMVMRRDLFNPQLMEYLRVDVTQDADFELQAGDRLVVYDQTTLTNIENIEISGSVRSPLTIPVEFDSTLRLADALFMAQGLQPTAISEAIVARRSLYNLQTIEHIRVDVTQEADFELRAGDRLVVYDRTSFNDLENIEISGSVRSPFTISVDFDSKLRLADALFMAQGLQPTAVSEAIVIRRELYNPQTLHHIRVDVTKDADFELRAGDQLIIYDQTNFSDLDTIEIAGSVRSPMSIPADFDSRLRLADALFMAEGLQPTATSDAFVFRKEFFNPEIINHIRVDVTKDADFELRAGDRLIVYDQTSYTNLGELSITGAVNTTMSTTFDPSLTVSDLLTMAGGTTRAAAMDRVEVFRLDVSFQDGTSYDIITLEVDDSLNVTNAPANFQLQPFDRIIVRRIPEYNVDANVIIEGEVKYPGNYPLESKVVRLSDLIKAAGGLTSTADVENAIIFRSFNNIGPIAVDLRKALSRIVPTDKHDPFIFEDDVITIPKKQNTVTIRLDATRIGDLQSFGLVDSTATLAREQVVNVLYKGNRSAKWYIRNFAGGFSPDADRWSVTVTKPNGEVQGTTRSLLFFRNYPNVEPGSTIALRYEPAEPAEPEELINWEEVQARSIQLTTSILTLMILLDRLAGN